MHLSPTVRAAIEAGPIGHVVTLGLDGGPQVSLAWIGLEGDEIVIGTMFDQAKLRITDGGAPALLQRLAQTYVGPGTVYPPMPNPPEGWVVHVAVERVSGSEAMRGEA